MESENRFAFQPQRPQQRTNIHKQVLLSTHSVMTEPTLPILQEDCQLSMDQNLGLGLMRKPSEKRVERPISNESIITTSTGELFSEKEQESRGSSVVAEEPKPLGMVNTTPYMFRNASSGSVRNILKAPLSKTASTSDLYMTPSQKLRLRRHKQRSVKESERFYDDNSDADEVDVDESVVWNIPMASHSTTTFIMNIKAPGPIEEPTIMPISPIPGVTPNAAKFEQFTAATNSLANFYRHKTETMSNTHLAMRQHSSDFLPLDMQQASEVGYEQLMLVSQDKLDALSFTRPSWLPPKSQHEISKHEREIERALSDASLQQKLDAKRASQLAEQRGKDVIKYGELVERGLIRQSTQQDLRKIVWRTHVPAEMRFSMYTALLNDDNYLQKHGVFEDFESVNALVAAIDFPVDKLAVIKQLISKHELQGTLAEDVEHMLKMCCVSSRGLDLRIGIVIHLVETFTLSQAWKLLNLLAYTVFGDATFKKFDARKSNSTLKHYLHNKAYDDELSNLTWDAYLDLLDNLPRTLMGAVLDVFVIHNACVFKPVTDLEQYKAKNIVVNYKIAYALVVNILLNHHIGWTDLKSIRKLQVLDETIFMDKWQYYFKKF